RLNLIIATVVVLHPAIVAVCVQRSVRNRHRWIARELKWSKLHRRHRPRRNHSLGLQEQRDRSADCGQREDTYRLGKQPHSYLLFGKTVVITEFMPERLRIR